MTGGAAVDAMDRLLVVHCPDLLEEDEDGANLRSFVEVIEAVEAYCPWVRAVRPGVCSLPARGPARYFGGEEPLVESVAAATSAITPAEVGVADGLFAAVLAARSGLVVPAGATSDFLAPFPVGILGRPELTGLLHRLGIRSLGEFAALPEPHVLGRFGADGVACHRVAGGRHGELEELRRPTTARRVAEQRGAGRLGRRAAGAGPAETGFWGGASDADARAGRALVAVQDLLGPDSVVTARLQGGRGPAQQARFVTWNAREGHGDATTFVAPWPGQIPVPGPGARAPRPPSRRAGRYRRRAGIGDRARPAHRPPRPAVGGEAALVGGDRLGRPLAVRRTLVVEVPPEKGAPAGRHGARGPPAGRRSGPLVGRSHLRMTVPTTWPTPSCTPTPTSRSSTVPAIPTSWSPRRPGWVCPASP